MGEHAAASMSRSAAAVARSTRRVTADPATAPEPRAVLARERPCFSKCNASILVADRSASRKWRVYASGRLAGPWFLIHTSPETQDRPALRPYAVRYTILDPPRVNTGDGRV
jgi:hypothetical protein